MYPSSQQRLAVGAVTNPGEVSTPLCDIIQGRFPELYHKEMIQNIILY